MDTDWESIWIHTSVSSSSSLNLLIFSPNKEEIMNAAVAGNDHGLETIGSLDAAAGGGGMGGFMLNDGGETMEDISSMLFGDTFGNQNGAINLRVEVYPNCDNDDSEFTVSHRKPLLCSN